jgi:hypothetical protein
LIWIKLQKIEDVEPQFEVIISILIFKTFFRNHKFLGIQIFNLEGRNLEFLGENLDLVLPQYMGVLDPNFIGGKIEIFITI